MTAQPLRLSVTGLFFPPPYDNNYVNSIQLYNPSPHAVNYRWQTNSATTFTTNPHLGSLKSGGTQTVKIGLQMNTRDSAKQLQEAANEQKTLNKDDIITICDALLRNTPVPPALEPVKKSIPKFLLQAWIDESPHRSETLIAVFFTEPPSTGCHYNYRRNGAEYSNISPTWHLEGTATRGRQPAQQQPVPSGSSHSRGFLQSGSSSPTSTSLPLSSSNASGGIPRSGSGLSVMSGNSSRRSVRSSGSAPGTQSEFQHLTVQLQQTKIDKAETEVAVEEAYQELKRVDAERQALQAKLKGVLQREKEDKGKIDSFRAQQTAIEESLRKELEMEQQKVKHLLMENRLLQQDIQIATGEKQRLKLEGDRFDQESNVKEATLESRVYELENGMQQRGCQCPLM
eukprot:TRINITY_DN3940_c0_g1_i1.p1 TRINITY_DN3940_c0_g1~~TRINITY_DN3940_c0_g1_i1.p1  ORF type:complete len:413 (-),score=52.91 TRINITY_DN3940_c0_g1_i1:420-1616(-)